MVVANVAGLTDRAGLLSARAGTHRDAPTDQVIENLLDVPLGTWGLKGQLVFGDIRYDGFGLRVLTFQHLNESIGLCRHRKRG